jgi:CYTH domain-containing protein
MPPASCLTEPQIIHDRYLPGTHLRLRQVRCQDGRTIWKLTRKWSAEDNNPLCSQITTIYLSEHEYQVLASGPFSATSVGDIQKRRFSYQAADRKYAIDQFLGPLAGLLLAEIEDEAHYVEQLTVLPDFAEQEVTCDPTFSGGTLAYFTEDQAQTFLTSLRMFSER